MKRPALQQVQHLADLYASERLPEALAEGLRLIELYPDAPLVLNILGSVQAALGRHDDAIVSYRRALSLRPDVAQAHYYLGELLARRGEREAALESFKQAVSLQPDYVLAHGALCRELERNNDISACTQALDRAEAQCGGGHTVLRLRRTELLLRAQQFEQARRLLEPSTPPDTDADTGAARCYLMADICDRLNDPDAAFTWACAANQLAGATFQARAIDDSGYRAHIDRLRQQFTADWVDSWRASSASESPVFLVGFPRSGTTLLDTLLRSHPDICVLEEQPVVPILEHALHSTEGGNPTVLAQLDELQLSGLRQIYLDARQTFVAPEDTGKLIIDKLPLNLVQAGLLYRLFPRARFLFARRHPCDSVLSGFMRQFELNEGMWQLLNLERAAGFYVSVMQLWRQYRQVLPLQVCEIVYEDLVRDMPTSLRPALEFLGLSWHDNLRQYDRTARQRAINTPSYNQVTETLHTHASGRWQRYRKHLEPVLPLLLPIADQLGYAEQDLAE